jgi:hypothetical protein
VTTYERERYGRYDFSVIDVASGIAGSVKGTGDHASPEHLAMLVDWLDWRTTVGWDLDNCDSYDDGVLSMARAAVRLGRKALGRDG